MNNTPFSSIELGAYHLGMASAKQAKEIERYLASNSGHVGELTQLDNYLNMLDDELPLHEIEMANDVSIWQQVVEQTRILVANLVPRPEPAFALLGDYDDGQRVYEADDIQIFVQVQDDDIKPDHHSILGMVAGMEGSDLQIQLWEAEQPDEVISAEVDEYGNFLMPHLAPATYELILSNDNTEVHIPEVIIY